MPEDLARQIGAFVEHYNHVRYHESIENITPADGDDPRRTAVLLSPLPRWRAFLRRTASSSLGYHAPHSRSGIGQLPVAEMEDAIEAVENLLIMCDGDDGSVALNSKVAQQVHDDAGPLGIERGGRLVG